jgi:Flp pilus assembly protein TadD
VARVPDPEACGRLAALELESGDTAAAGRLLAELPAADLARPDAALRLAEAEGRAGRFELGLLRIDAGLRKAADPAPLLAEKGVLLREDGRFEDALVVHEQLLAEHRDSPEAVNAVAFDLALLRRNLERAEALAQAAVSATHGDPGALDTLAAVQLARGDAASALASIERALPRAAPANRELLQLRRAEALARLGRRREARTALAEARRAPPRAGRVYEEVLHRAEAELAGS